MISLTIFQYNLINRLGWNSLTLLFRYKVHENHFLYINSKKKTQFLTSNACAHSFVLCTSHWHTILSMLWLIVSSICFQKKAINLLNYVRISVHSDTTNQLCKIFWEHHYWQLQPLCANKHCAILVTVIETKCLWPLWKGNSLGSWSAVKQLKYSYACSEERTRMQPQGKGRFNHFSSTKMTKVKTG